MLLSILIPTYNRSAYLKKNLDLLDEIISKSNYFKDIEVLVSNNNSTDNTEEVIKSNNKIYIKYFNQNINIGPLANCLFLLEKATAKYIMYLGDDDYLDMNYIDIVLDKLIRNLDISCVIPSTKSLFPDGIVVGGRDIDVKSKTFNAGFINCLLNSHRGTQLSGVIHLREGLFEKYNANSVNNLYPFVYFVSVNCLRGKTWLCTNYPVTITQMISGTENVNYGYTNLIEEVFNNYNHLESISYLERVLLEMQLLIKQPSRYMSIFRIYKFKGIYRFGKLFLTNRDTSVITKILFPLVVFRELVIRVFRLF